MAAASHGCNRVSCEELHDPTCWIPPAEDAGSDAEDDAPDAAAADSDAPDDATADSDAPDDATADSDAGLPDH
jgi:hypothetical protein